MRKLRTALCLPIAIGVLALPSAASAEYLVPPDNSAATQYTETVPTAGGQRETEKGGKRGGGSPRDVLGADKARRLGEQGREGREVAELVVESAPAGTAPPDPPAAATVTEETGQTDRKDGGDRDERDEEVSGGGVGEARGGPPAGAQPAMPDGSSGFAEVLARATGWSSSEGLMLLAVFGAVAWGLAFLRRERNRSTA